jgi:tripartite-type tricarboxylate transporter receptor subunit TctC
VAATGLPGYDSVSMTGILAPAKTPAAVINRLNQEVVRVLNQPDVKARFFANGADTVGNTPDEFLAIIKSDIARTDKIIKAAGIKAE